jgi:hypothetical protein
MNYQLGKRDAKFDPRTLKLKSVFKTLPAVPELWDVDRALGLSIPTPMFANDKHGDCVIAGRAHQTLRFEAVEQNRVLPISDEDVVREYFLQTGGADGGLNMLDSLKDWRHDGWEATTEIKTSRKILCLPIATRAIKKTYTIYAYGAVDPKDHNDVKACIFLLSGLYTGLLLPRSAQNQAVWDVAEGDDGKPGSWGGHCVYVAGYDAVGLVCITWGEKKRMTWAFFDKYCDEAFGIVDNKDNWVENSPVDTDRLESYLNSL